MPWLVLGPAVFVGVLVSKGLGGLNAGLCVALGATPLGPAILALPILRWRQSVTVYERGLVHRSLLGTKSIAAADVTGVKHTLFRRRYSKVDEVVIHRAGQRGHFITGISEAQKLANIVRAWTTSRAVPGGVQAPDPAPQAPAPGGWVPPAER